MVMCIWGTGSKTMHMDVVIIIMRRVHRIRDPGSTTNKRASERNNGQTANLTQEITLMGRSMVQAPSNGVMEPATLATGSTIKCTETERSSGLTGGNTKANIKMTK